MKTEEEDKIIDDIISRSLKDGIPRMQSDSFTDKLMIRIQQGLAWRVIMTEFLWKSAMVVILLLFAVEIFFLPQFGEFLKVLSGLTSNWQLLVSAAVVGFFIFAIDQVLLKYLMIRKK